MNIFLAEFQSQMLNLNNIISILDWLRFQTNLISMQSIKCIQYFQLRLEFSTWYTTGSNNTVITIQ